MLLLLPNQIEWIRRLAGEGLSVPQICQMTGISRGTICKLLDPQPLQQNPLLLETIYDVDEPFFVDQPRRCPTCGATCYMPCLRCYLQKLNQEQAAQPPPPKPPPKFPPGIAS